MSVSGVQWWWCVCVGGGHVRCGWWRCTSLLSLRDLFPCGASLKRSLPLRYSMPQCLAGVPGKPTTETEPYHLPPPLGCCPLPLSVPACHLPLPLGCCPLPLSAPASPARLGTLLHRRDTVNPPRSPRAPITIQQHVCTPPGCARTDIMHGVCCGARVQCRARSARSFAGTCVVRRHRTCTAGQCSPGSVNRLCCPARSALGRHPITPGTW